MNSLAQAQGGGPQFAADGVWVIPRKTADRLLDLQHQEMDIAPDRQVIQVSH
jgi:hypothetical protein